MKAWHKIWKKERAEARTTSYPNGIPRGHDSEAPLKGRGSNRVPGSYLTEAFCLFALVLLNAVEAKGGEIDYDQLNARGLQLVKNGSFEEMHRDGVRPADWGVPENLISGFKVIADAGASKHGSAYVTVVDGTGYLYGGLEGTPSGKLRMAVWAKGEGEVALIITLMAPNWRNQKTPILARQTSEWFPVNSRDWVEYSHDFDVPESIELEGKAEKPESIRVQIGVKGNISLDQCSAVSIQALEQAKREIEARKVQTDGLRPFFAIPKLVNPPRIDGKIGEEEWNGAAAATGFTQLNTKKLASRQTVVYAGFDDNKLYFAFCCPHEGQFGPGKAERDVSSVSQTEGIEVWLQPPGGGWFQFLGCPAGGIVDISERGGVAWNGNWEFQNHVEDSDETAGGVLLFARKTWTAEVAIPFKDLGTAVPKPGEQWRVNFCRDFSVAQGERRGADDWTSWSPIEGKFQNSKQFASAVFRDDIPAVQVLRLGDLPNGDLSVEGLCGGRGGKVRIEASAIASEGDKTLSFRSEEIAAAADKPSQFALSDTLRVAGATDISFHVLAEEIEYGSLLYRSVIPFTATAALRMRLIPVASRNVLYVEVDAGRLPALPSRVRVEAAIYRDGSSTGVSASAVWDKGSARGELQLDTAKLILGDYQVKTFLKEDAGEKALASSTGSFCLPEKPEWLGNKIGISDEVPAPWRPIESDGGRVAITEREYSLANTGLPEQIAALGEDLFAAPPRLRAVVDGEELSWDCRPLETVSRQDNETIWRIEGQAGPLAIEGTLKVEFDGFALWNVSIRSNATVTVDSLRMEFPFRPERALYARGRNTTEEDGAYHACLYPTKEPSAEDICRSHFSGKGWVWPDKWVHEIWIGDDCRGFSVMCETQEYLRGERRTEIEQSEKANTLKVYLIDGPYELKGPLRYQYAWQATPVKPKPQDPKIWHVTYRPFEEEGFLKRIYVTLDYHALKYISYPALFQPRQAVDRKNAIYRKHGIKIVPYFSVQMGTTDAPELKPFLSEWEKYPVRTLSTTRGGCLLACASSSFGDFAVYAAKKIVDELGFDGLYLDVSGVHDCSNHYHGCGYKLQGQEEWQPTVNIFALREVYKRLYRLYKSEGRDAVLFRHTMPVAAIAGFVDVVTQGEDWCREGTNQYDRLTPDIFRAKTMKIQYGTPYTWYTFHHYYRGIKFGGRVPLDAILAYCLPHGVLPTEGRAGMWPVWDVTDQFWTSSEFIPYWDTRSPVEIAEERVLGSVYWKRAEKKALLVVANWNTEPRAVEVKIDLASLGMEPGRARATRALNYPIRQPEDPPVEQPMADEPIVLREGKLHLRLAGRNLELILLEEGDE